MKPHYLNRKIRKTTLSILVFSFIALVGCDNRTVEEKARWRINYLTDIEVPLNSTMLWSYTGDQNVVGRAKQYSIFSFETKPKEFLIENNFIADHNEEFKNKYLNLFEDIFGYPNSIKSVEVPSEFKPMLDDDYVYLNFEGEGICFVYYIEIQRLTFFVSFY